MHRTHLTVIRSLWLHHQTLKIGYFLLYRYENIMSDQDFSLKSTFWVSQGSACTLIYDLWHCNSSLRGKICLVRLEYFHLKLTSTNNLCFYYCYFNIISKSVCPYLKPSGRIRASLRKGNIMPNWSSADAPWRTRPFWWAMLQYGVLQRNLQQCFRSNEKHISEQISWSFPFTPLRFTAQSGLRAHPINIFWMKLSQMFSRTAPNALQLLTGS